MFDFIDAHNAWTVVHIFGIAIGAGAALVSDSTFFTCLKDNVFSASEIRLLKHMSRMVWIGLAILAISGVFLVLGNTDRYFHSAKFLAKMTVVLVIAVNGFIFHITHLPRIVRHEGKNVLSSPEFVKHSGGMFISGALSVASWVFALLLGGLRGVPYSYGIILGIYSIAVGIAIGVSLFIHKRRITDQAVIPEGKIAPR